jgi:hydroxylamine reductase
LQDLLTYSLTGLSVVAAAGRNVGIVNKNIDVFTCEALFTTVTNVNFDPERIVGLIKKTLSLRDEMIEEVRTSSGMVNVVHAAAKFRPANTLRVS